MKGKIVSQIKDPDLIRKRHLQIARKTSRLFLKKGYSATGMREISKTTGITIGNLYDYITKKEDVLCLVFDVHHRLWTEHLEKNGVHAIADPLEQLETAVRRMLELAHENADFVLLMYRESKHLPKRFMKDVLAKEIELIEFFEGILRRGIKKNVFHIDDTFYSASMIVYELSFEPLRGWSLKGKKTNRDLIDLTVRHIMKAVL
ncbi:MAG: TetR family transcriptional regulator [Deltaproteobacteria bacterium HGW-Deltaproteobacteria-7]|jgi:AcrR family transcriptional regulator|nr:MAG: TetR family transcriptional regulator [Deltaproteobacteria bacterium HGW-Deltaproteobacteria-7]PKN51136.1 MAG: TetR family transcriptional regulator [Deltaproteobacteria bacterium HGW-Deltaproteobacteria-13]